MVSAVAIRGGLSSSHVCAPPPPDAIQNDALNIVEIDADDEIANVVTYDVEDIDAAIAELDADTLQRTARYAHTWSVSRVHTPRSTDVRSRNGAGLRERRPPPGQSCTVT